MLHNKELNRNPCHKHKLFLYDTNCITFYYFYRAMFSFSPGVNWIEFFIYIHTPKITISSSNIISFNDDSISRNIFFIYHRVSSSSHFSRHIVNVYSFINVLFMMGTKKIYINGTYKSTWTSFTYDYCLLLEFSGTSSLSDTNNKWE